MPEKKEKKLKIESETFSEIVEGEIVKKSEKTAKKDGFAKAQQTKFSKKEFEEKRSALKKYEKLFSQNNKEESIITTSSFNIIENGEMIPPELRKKIKEESISEEEKREKIESSMKNSTMEGVFNSASGSIQSSFTTPFALALGASNVEIGLMASLQNFAGAISHIPGALLTKYFTRKSIWVFSHVIGRILLWIPVLFLPFLTLEYRIWIFIGLVTFSNFFVMLRSPAWSSMMGDLVPEEKRSSYFSRRNMLIGLAGVFSTLAGGFLITYFGFQGIFILSIIFGLIAIFYFIRMYEPPMKKIFHYTYTFSFKPREWWLTLKLNKEFVIFTVFLTFINFAIDVAAPFYAVYMLKDLNITYEWFAFSVVLGALVKALSMRNWGNLIERFGTRKILIVTGVLACFVPFGWLLSTNLIHVILIRIYDGLVFSGFELVVFQYLLEVTPTKKRPKYIAAHNFFSSMGVVLGDLFGAFLVMCFSEGFLIFSSLQFVFLVSFILRLSSLTSLLFIKSVEVKQSDIVPVRYVFWQALVVEPARGIKNTIAYTFRYPVHIEKELREGIKKLKYTMKLKLNK
jgi:MFS family permease